MASLPESAKAWLDGTSFPVLATTNADGTPQTTVHWAARDGDDILMSTVKGRLHARNLERDPRVSVMLVDPGDPYRYVEVRATATLTEEGGRELIDDLSARYRGVRPYRGDGPDAVRVVVRIPPDKVVARGV